MAEEEQELSLHGVRAEARELEQVRAEQVAKLGELRGRLEACETENRRLEEQTARWQQDCRGKDGRIEALRGELAREDALLRDYQQRIADYEAKIGEQERRLAAFCQTLRAEERQDRQALAVDEQHRIQQLAQQVAQVARDDVVAGMRCLGCATDLPATHSGPAGGEAAGGTSIEIKRENSSNSSSRRPFLARSALNQHIK